MDVVHAREVLQNAAQLLVPARLRELHLAHVELADARDGVPTMHHRRRLALRPGKHHIDEILRRGDLRFERHTVRETGEVSRVRERKERGGDDARRPRRARRRTRRRGRAFRRRLSAEASREEPRRRRRRRHFSRRAAESRGGSTHRGDLLEVILHARHGCFRLPRAPLEGWAGACLAVPDAGRRLSRSSDASVSLGCQREAADSARTTSYAHLVSMVITRRFLELGKALLVSIYEKMNKRITRTSR